MSDCPYPWLTPAWDTLAEALRGAHLGHAYLLTGREGLGKTELARAFTRVLLCEKRDNAADAACGHCRGCTLLETGAHADFHEVTIEPDRTGTPHRIAHAGRHRQRRQRPLHLAVLTKKSPALEPGFE